MGRADVRGDLLTLHLTEFDLQRVIILFLHNTISATKNQLVSTITGARLLALNILAPR
jgi:hypothetical protein